MSSFMAAQGRVVTTFPVSVSNTKNFGGLRVAVTSWQRGEDRAEAHQHVRSVALTLARAVSATYPYRASRSLAPEPVVLFSGTEKRVEFVTQTAPFPFAIPIAFTPLFCG